jgi:hypothetical protein
MKAGVLRRTNSSSSTPSGKSGEGVVDDGVMIWV